MATPPLGLDPSDWALFLDIDGTLLELQPRPEDVRSDAELIQLLEGLCHRFQDAVALISGRPVTDIDRIFAPSTFSAAGSHGAECRLAGETHDVLELPTLPEATLQRGKALANQHAGLLMELKLHGAAMHYRGAPEAQELVLSWIQRECEQLGEAFCILVGKMVYELVPAEVDKGSALQQLLGCDRFANRKPIFIGDDVTDEPGFEVTNRHDGLSIYVGKGEQSLATLRLNNVAKVREWLTKAFI
jgi:trehalose 6-phosphate phosphatase